MDMDIIDSTLESSHQAEQEGEDQSKVWPGRTMCKAIVKGKLKACSHLIQTTTRQRHQLWTFLAPVMDVTSFTCFLRILKK